MRHHRCTVDMQSRSDVSLVSRPVLLDAFSICPGCALAVVGALKEAAWRVQ